MTLHPAQPPALHAREARSPGAPAAVVFDADGVLVDTAPAWRAARRTLFERHGRPFGEAERRQTLGTGVAGTAALLSGKVLIEPGRAAELSEELLALLIDEISMDPPRPLPGADELVEALAGRVPIAVASNSPSFVLLRSLAAAGLDGRFDAVFGGDDVAEGKPAPDLYLTAVKCLGAEPTESVAVEDSAAGVTSARLAGLYVIGVQANAGDMLQADYVVESLGDPGLRARLGPINQGMP